MSTQIIYSVPATFSLTGIGSGQQVSFTIPLGLVCTAAMFSLVGTLGASVSVTPKFKWLVTDDVDVFAGDSTGLNYQGSVNIGATDVAAINAAAGGNIFGNLYFDTFATSLSVTSLALVLTISGSNASQVTSWYPQFGGVPPLQILWSNNQLPAANVPPVPPVSNMSGSIEAGNGTISNLAAGIEYTIHGPLQCYDRKSFNQVWFVQGTGAFNLDYQYTPDQGANWYIGKQVPSSTVTVDGGAAGYTQEARFVVQPGYQYRICLFNTSGGAINLTWEHRYVGKKG